MSSLQNEKSECVPEFENLPDVILSKIFSYLYIGDLCRAGRVCYRWYQMSRSQVLWRHVDAHNMQLTSYQVQKLIFTLPPCVRYLRICSHSIQHHIPFITPRAAIEIRERCPHLKTLIIESAYIAKHIHFTDITIEDLPQQLSVLSLRKSFFHTDQFFCSVSHPTVPKIKVLDCTSCWCICDNDIPFFSRLSDLQEIYLSNCSITDIGVVPLLSAVKNLKVLDLERTGIGGATITSLSVNCPSLEKLYLGYTRVSDSNILHLENSCLPILKILCLRDTTVSQEGLEYLVSSLKALKYLSISSSALTTSTLELLMQKAQDKRLTVNIFKDDEKKEKNYFCDHFLSRDNNSEC